MKLAVLCLLALAATNGALATRRIMQLPTLPESEPFIGLAQTPAPTSQAPAPAPFGLPGTCALEYLVNAGNFNSLIELVEAASQSAEIAQILDSSASAVTLLAPTDAGVQKALSYLGITMESLLADPSRITDILLYHVLPSQIQASDLVSGYSFNTQLTQGGIAQSVTIQGSGATSTFVGKSSSAPGLGSINTACNINVIPIDGLLVP